MAPAPRIRVGIIGLSVSAVTSWAADAHLPCFLTQAGRERYHIVALCNSSVAAAEASIRTYNLPLDTKAYGSPADLAADPDVDLVICNTRVDKHFETTLPSLRAGKDVYIEWPIASTLADVDALLVAARQSGARTLVGLQGRWAPPVLKIKELLATGAIGQLLSSEVHAYGGSRDRDVLPVGLRYFAQRVIGGNPITIGFAHVIDFVQSVVGELVPGSVHTHFQLQRPNVRIRDPARNDEIVETIRSDVPDLLSLHGFVTPHSNDTTTQTEENHHHDASSNSDSNSDLATLTFQFRRGPPFPGTPSLTWTLSGTQGEIRLAAQAGISLQADAYGAAAPVTIQLHAFASDTVEDVPWAWDERQREVPVRARSVLRCLYAWADDKFGQGLQSGGSTGGGDDGGRKGWVDLEDAARRARQIWEWLEEWQGLSGLPY